MKEEKLKIDDTSIAPLPCPFSHARETVASDRSPLPPFYLIALLSLALTGAALLFHFLSSSQKLALSSQQERWTHFLSAQSSLSSETQISTLLTSEVLPGASKLVLGQKININQASLNDLMALPGIGPKMAQKIIEDRTLHGSYRKLEALMRVKGIKEKKFEKVKAYITL